MRRQRLHLARPALPRPVDALAAELEEGLPGGDRRAQLQDGHGGGGDAAHLQRCTAGRDLGHRRCGTRENRKCKLEVRVVRMRDVLSVAALVLMEYAILVVTR